MATSPSAAGTSGDYTYDMQVGTPLPRVLDAVTDDGLIRAWWTAATSSERHGDDVRLFSGDRENFVSFTIDHAPGSGDVAWAVTACVVEDWVGTKPTFSVRRNDDGTTAIRFRHVGLRPELECFDMCRDGWNHFMPSLHQYLETGAGRPNEPRDPSA
jgi:uncharacterized protein YndB with AHSA1/START domain